MAKKKAAKGAGTAVAEAPKSQKTIEGAFAPEDTRMEELVDSFLKAEGVVIKAKDKRTTAYDALKEEMREQNLEVYYCYRTRKRVRLAPEDAKVKVESVKDDESTPFQASRAKTDE